MDAEKVIHASDITDCAECPLYDHDCCGGWASSGSGTPIEPPCTSWNDDEEIYEGMYDRYSDWYKSIFVSITTVEVCLFITFYLFFRYADNPCTIVAISSFKMSIWVLRICKFKH